MPQNFGLDANRGLAILAALHVASGTATVGTDTMHGPTVLRAMASAGSDDASPGTEIGSGSSYTAGATGLGSLSFAAPSNIANTPSQLTNGILSKTSMPARTINGLEEFDSSSPQKRVFWGIVTQLITNVNDTVSIAASAYAAAIQ